MRLVIILGDKDIMGNTGREKRDGASNIQYREAGKCYPKFQTVNTLRVVYTCLSGLQTRRRLRGLGRLWASEPAVACGRRSLFTHNTKAKHLLGTL